MSARGISANRQRGEICARLGGTDYRLCLTLGALAELEDALGASNLNELVARLTSGTLSARDLIALLGAGLRGGGNVLNDADIAKLVPDGGIAALVKIAGELLEAAFGRVESDAPNPS